MAESKEVTVQRTGGVGVFGLLGVVFVALKLTGHITWSWWWVTAPFWGPLALWLVVLAFLFTMAGVASFVSRR